MSIHRVGVVGAGTMGNGIAHVFARSGYMVVLCDVEQRFLDRGLTAIAKNLDREVAKNKLSTAEKATTSSSSSMTSVAPHDVNMAATNTITIIITMNVLLLIDAILNATAASNNLR